MSTFQEYTTISGQSIQIDTSNETCNKYGYTHEERITIGNDTGTFIGVAPPPQKTDHLPRELLWVILDKNNGRVCFGLSPKHPFSFIYKEPDQ